MKTIITSTLIAIFLLSGLLYAQNPLMLNPCDDIISLAGGGSANSKTFQSLGSGVWHTTRNNACGHISPGQEQVYSFVAPMSGVYSIHVTNTNGKAVSYIFKSGDCNPPPGFVSWGGTCIADVDSPGIYGSFNLEVGTTYYILLDAITTDHTAHHFYIYRNPCLNIFAINGLGSGFPIAYLGGLNGSWNTTTNSPCGSICPGIENIWSIVAPYDGTYSIQVTGADGYVDYLWKSGSCSSSGWNCISRVNSSGRYGAMNWSAGTTYYILLDDEDTNFGIHMFYVREPDPCLDIIPINGLGAGNIQSYNGGGTGIWYSTTANACGYTSPGKEQIYSILPLYSGNYQIEVTSASGNVNYMWKSGSCSPSGWTCISRVNSTGQYGNMNWTGGTAYYLLLDDEDVNSGLHMFYIIGPDPCVDIIPINGLGVQHSQSYNGGGMEYGSQLQ